MELTQISRDDLIDGGFYIGRGRNGNVGRWFAEGGFFMVPSLKFGRPVIKAEGYFEEEEGCFQPFLLVDEGEVIEPLERRYAKTLRIPSE